MPQIFLSHSRVDQPKLKEFINAFEASPQAKKHKLTFWLDDYDIDNSSKFPEQIEDAIYSEDTCAFALHLSESIYLENGELRPWIKEEVSLAKQRLRADERNGKKFAIVPFTLFDKQGKVAAPRTISMYQGHSQVYENNRLNSNTDRMISKILAEKNPSRAPHESTLTASTELIWLSFEIYRDDKTIQSICLQDDEGESNKQSLDISQILPFKRNDQSLQKLTQLLLGDEQHTLHCIKQSTDNKVDSLDDSRLRIRVVTDDPELAMLPWHLCRDTKTNKPLHQKNWIIEQTPPKPFPRDHFISCSLNSPLLVIPANDEYITCHQHRSLIENYLQAHLDIQGEIPHARTPEQLKMKLEHDQPDLIYVGACFNQGWEISLDKDISQQSTVSLNQLADWIEAAEIAPPVVILNLIGEPLAEYPEKLVNVSRLVWSQTIKRHSKFDLLTTILEQTLQKLNTHHNDLLASIVSQSVPTTIDSFVCVKGRSFQIKNDVNKHQAKQLRAALLRVMLGRDDIKASLYNQISHSQNARTHQLFIFAVTGTKQACPFDVPAQIRQRLQWDDPEKSLPILPLPFDLSIATSGLSASMAIDTAQSSGLGSHSSSDISSILEARLDEHNLLHEECCISMNWCIKTNSASPDTISEWLQEWRDFMHDDFVGNIPENKLLLINACIQVNDEEQAQTVQDTVNQILRDAASRPMRPIRHADALGRLDEYEISNFFYDNPHWHNHLKLDENNIDSDDYTQWILQQAGGQFEKTVRLIWQQYQRNYQDYNNQL